MNVATRRLTVAVAGNPNCGKTTVFNALTGTRQKIGNWPGVTIERKEGKLRPGVIGRTLAEPFVSHERERPVEAGAADVSDDVVLVDLPGIYALSAGSEDEIVALDYLLSGEPDFVINIVDASNLERNLYLTTQLRELGVPVLVVLNMMDLAEAKHHSIDPVALSKRFGCFVVSAIAVRRDGVAAVGTALADMLSQPSQDPLHIEYPPAIEASVDNLAQRIESLESEASVRWSALKALEGDRRHLDRLESRDPGIKSAIERAKDGVHAELGTEVDIALADARYRFIQQAVAASVRKGKSVQSISDRVDRVLMHRLLGIPIFLAAMYAVFWLTISVGGAFIDFFDILFGTVFVDGFGALLSGIGSPDWLVTILASGIGAGIQTVATFIPIIFFMFLLLSILEDSGYMARAAFVMDRFMRWIGLPGKSFVPMLLGLGCTIPAILGTRTLESRRDRFLTIFMTPFMSCGARLPVYALFAAAFFPRQSGLVVFSLYLIGIVLAVGTGLLLKRTLFIGTVSHFVMELPPYHAPRFHHIMRETWNRLRAFIKRAGIVIVLVVTVLSFLNSFGVGEDGVSFGNEDSQTSVLARIGRGITPIFHPMGIEDENWPATVGLFTGLFAKEAVVGTLSSLYSQQISAEAGGGTDVESFSFWAGIGESLRSIPDGLAGIFGGLSDPLGTGMVSGDEEAVGEELDTSKAVFARLRTSFDPAGAYAYLLFVLIYFPCVSALGAAVQEMGPKLGWLLAGYLTVLAWIVATLVYQIGAGPTLPGLLLPVLLAGGLVIAVALIGRTMRRRGTGVYAE